MTVSVKWYSEDEHILLVKFDPPVAWDDFYHMIDMTKETTRDTRHRFDIIGITNSPMPPGNPLPHFNHLNKFMSQTPNFGLYVTVNPAGASVVVRTVTTLMQLMGVQSSRGEFAPSLEAAYQRILSHRQETLHRP